MLPNSTKRAKEAMKIQIEKMGAVDVVSFCKKISSPIITPYFIQNCTTCLLAEKHENQLIACLNDLKEGVQNEKGAKSLAKELAWFGDHGWILNISPGIVEILKSYAQSKEKESVELHEKPIEENFSSKESKKEIESYEQHEQPTEEKSEAKIDEAYVIRSARSYKSNIIREYLQDSTILADKKIHLIDSLIKTMQGNVLPRL